MNHIDMKEVDREVLRVIALSGIPTEMIIAPETGKPYIVIHPIRTGEDMTALQLDSFRDADYQLDYVGRGWEQVRDVQTKVHAVLVAGLWDASKGVGGATVSGAGQIARQDERTWQCSETLRVKVSNT